MSYEHLNYIKNLRRQKVKIFITQILIFIIFMIIWELLARNNYINTFLTSSPTLILNSIINLIKSNNLFNHIFITLYETILSFILSMIIGITIASILWWNKTLCKILDPYLTILNSLPKVALGPILIIWIGANTKSIITMALLISTIINIINILDAFNNTDKNKIKLMQSFNATKFQIYKMLILRSNLNNILSTSKINISMCLTGLIPSVGENRFLNKYCSKY